jgi:hypothetical protein
VDFPSRFRSSNGCFPWRRYAFNFTRIRGKFPLLSLIEGRRKNSRDHRRLIRSSEPFFNRIPEGLPVRRDRSQPSKFYGDFGEEATGSTPSFPGMCRGRGANQGLRHFLPDGHGPTWKVFRSTWGEYPTFMYFRSGMSAIFFFVTGNVLHFLHNVQTTITFVQHIG